MRRPFVGVVRVITSDESSFVGTHGRWIEKQYGLPTVSRCIPDQPHGVHDDETYAQAVPKIVAVAKELAAEGAACVLISCAADPGLAEPRAVVGIPVVGAASAGAAVALGLGGKVGVIGLNDEAPKAIRDVLASRLVASVRPEGVRRTTDLLRSGASDRAMAGVRSLVDAGAEVVLFACTGFTTIGLGARGRAELDVPVVDAVLAAGLVASYVVQEGNTE